MKTKMNIREAARYIEKENPSFKDFYKKNSAYSKSDANELYLNAQLLIESRQFLEKARGVEKYCVDTFRHGYIGKKVTDTYGSEFVQTRRGRPYGYLAAVLGNDDKVYVGYTFISENELFPHPVIGQAIALKNALANRAKEISCDKILDGSYQGKFINCYLNSDSKMMLKHFYDRARRYFLPEVYSYSRGLAPLQDPNFVDIHLQQFAQAVINAKDQNEFETLLERFLKMIKLSNDKLDVDKFKR